MSLLSLTLGLGLAATLAADAAPADPTGRLPRPLVEPVRPGPNRPAEAISFRALWSDPEKYQGRRVVVRGRLARRFSQSAVGSFPALNEDWIFDDQQNPFCVVSYREHAGGNVGDRVEFAGKFLRLARYKASDGDRLAPVLVDVRGPTRLVAPPPAIPANTTRWDRIMARVPGPVRRRHARPSASPPPVPAAHSDRPGPDVRDRRRPRRPVRPGGRPCVTRP